MLGLKASGTTAQHISKGCAGFWCLSLETSFLPITTAADGSIPCVLCIAPASFSAYIVCRVTFGKMSMGLSVCGKSLDNDILGNFIKIYLCNHKVNIQRVRFDFETSSHSLLRPACNSP